MEPFEGSYEDYILYYNKLSAEEKARLAAEVAKFEADCLASIQTPEGMADLKEWLEMIKYVPKSQRRKRARPKTTRFQSASSSSSGNNGPARA